MGSIVQPGMLGKRSCMPRRVSKQTQAKAASSIGPSSPAAPQPSWNPAVKQIGSYVLTAVGSVSGTYLLSVYKLQGKVDRLADRLDGKVDRLDVKVDTRLDTLSGNVNKLSDKLDKLSDDTAEYRREVAQVRGAFQILLDKYSPPKK